MVLSAYGATHPGLRPSNEDAWLVDESLGLFVVADGMGGHNAGEVASSMAVETMARSIRTCAERSATRLEHALRAANASILESAVDQPERSGMGTTVAAVLALDEGFAVASVGDSRVYRWRAGHLEQLTRDDSWVSQLFPDGEPGSAQARQRHPMRHVLTDVVGVRPNLDPRSTPSDLAPGDAFLLCSDGLHGALPLERLLSCFASGTAQGVATRLVREAVDAGASDNVTVVVVCRDA
jgi:serine/threonine protein phosphatase PrpC